MLDDADTASNVLPSIHHVGHTRGGSDHSDRPRFSLMPLTVSTGPRSPAVSNSDTPTLYSTGSTGNCNMHERPGYISPPESTTRRSTREEKESPFVVKSLPSIHEALGDRSILNPTSSSGSEICTSGSTPATGTASSFPDFPTGPSGPTNPFSQQTFKPPSSSAPINLSSEPRPLSPRKQEYPPTASQPTSAPSHDTKPPPIKSYQYPASPRASFSHPVSHAPGPPVQATSHAPVSTYQPASVNYSSSTSTYNAHPPPPPSIPSNQSHLEAARKPAEARHSFSEPGHAPPYGDTVKRRLDVYDTEVAFHEISEASARTVEFATYWSRRHYQSNHSHVLSEGIPPLQDIDEALRHGQKVMENLYRVREVAIAQQAALSEERARMAHCPPNEQYRSIMDEFKAGGLAAGDAKKRRGKAAPPGRCHSCNRAETPEWRRGPDGARTLCNACGLHYAKLTRKLSANKIGHVAASSLRPKGLDGRI